MAGPYYVEQFVEFDKEDDDKLEVGMPEIVDGRTGNRLTVPDAIAEILNKIQGIETKVAEGLAQIDPVMTQLRPMLSMMGLG